MFKPGAILKISVTHFVTYSYAEFYPGDRLNIILGANGTGKSTMVAAIILGLGGSPKTVGRGSKVSEYVMHDCDDSEIEIVLKGELDKDVIVTRKFNKFSKSKWLINGEEATLNDVLKRTSKLQIQVNNLCQFLPQDKVQDFAKLTKQELLRQTQLALCRPDLVEAQTELIEHGKEQRVLFSNLTDLDKKLANNHEANARLESKMKNLDLRKNLEAEALNVRRKIAWVHFEAAQEQCEEVKADHSQAEKAVAARQRQLDPYRKTVNDVNVKLRETNASHSQQIKKIKASETVIALEKETQENIKKSIDTVEEEKAAALQDIHQRQFEIDSCNLKINQLQNEKDKMADTHAPGVADLIDTLKTDLRDLVRSTIPVADSIATFEERLRQTAYELRALHAETERLENVRTQRLQWLRGRSRDAYEGALWLRENGDKFRGAVYGPMMLELNILDPKYSVYLENTVSFNDRVAFTCVLKDDMNLLLKFLRVEKGLTVNVVHSGDTGNDHFQPKTPIEQLRKYGLYAYCNTLISGPDPLMRYLCRTYNLHNVPIGNDLTNKHSDEVGQYVSVFYSDQYRYNKTGSRYDKNYSSIIQRRLGQDSGCLSISVNTTRLQEIRVREAELNETSESLKNGINTTGVRLEEMKKLQGIIKGRLNAALNLREQILGVDKKLNYLREKCRDLSSDDRTPQSIEQDAGNKIKGLLAKLVKSQRALLLAIQNIRGLAEAAALLKAEMNVYRIHLVHAENMQEDALRLYNEAKRLYQEVSEALRNAKSNVSERLTRAKKLTKGFNPSEPGFDEFRSALDELPNDDEALQTNLDLLQTRIDCTTVANEHEIRDYERRKEMIEQYTTTRDSVAHDLVRVEETMNEVRVRWLRPLVELVDRISKRFANAFERMGCAGEVTICTGGQNDDIVNPTTSTTTTSTTTTSATTNTTALDYTTYGLAIRVTYRNGEPLQELNTVTQSGGERSVATAAYMLSLQTLTPAPFRCVDEINQGMDAHNERRIFDLLVECTTDGRMEEVEGEGEQTAQYFLVTPKLIPGLRFNKNMKIHIIHNGPYSVNQMTWNNFKLRRD